MFSALPSSSPVETLHPPAGQKRQRTTAWVLAASVALYLLALGFGSARHSGHLDIVLLLLQYGPILVGATWYLRTQRITRGTAETATLPRLNLLAVVACFALVAIPLSWFSTRGLLNPDESGYSFQARLYRSGRLMADPLVGATQDVLKTPLELFYANHILRPYGWFPKFPPGWPLLLSLGYLIHARWLPNAIFGTLQLFVIAAIGSRWFSRETGVLAALFAALSQFYLISSIGMMSHALCALLAATACLALSAAISTGKLRYYAAMFACLAGTFQVRPYTGFVLTFLLTCAALWFARKDQRLLIKVLGIGALFGALAVAGVLIYDRIYTGHWLVSPYAEAAGGDTPPELSLGPASVLRGVMRHGPFMLLETLLGAFPFLHLLAGYAIVQEKNHRREVWLLAALYLGLVLSYLAHPEGYAVFFGERFHFEAFFALALLAARGTQLLVERWQIRRRTVGFALVVLAALQIGQVAFAVQVVARRGEPYRKVREAVTNSNFSGVVFLHDSPGFIAKHFNLNDADWRHAPRVYLVDVEADHRAEWVCRYGFSHWLVASYDRRAHAAIVEPGETDCSAAKAP